MKIRTAIAIFVVGICGIFDGVVGQFGGFGGGGGGGGLLGAISNVVPGGCPSPEPFKNFELEEVPRIIKLSTVLETLRNI